MWFVNSCYPASCSTTNLSCKLVLLCRQTARKPEKVHRLPSSASTTNKLRSALTDFYSSPAVRVHHITKPRARVQTPSTSPTNQPASQAADDSHQTPWIRSSLTSGKPLLATLSSLPLARALNSSSPSSFSFWVSSPLASSPSVRKKQYLPIAYMRAVPKLTIPSSRPFCSQRARHWNSSFFGHRVCLPAPPLPLVLKCDSCLTMLRRVGTVYMFCAVGVYV